CSHRHRWGTAADRGLTGIRSPISVHSGTSCSFSNPRYSSSSVVIMTPSMTRFIASVECRQALRVGSREGMVFPAHRTTAGLLLLAELPEPELDEVYAAHRYAGRLV